MQPARNRVRTQLIFFNGIGALALLVYGWFCLRSDSFYLPLGRSHHTLRGIGCVLMVGVLVCFAVLLLLPVARAYLPLKHRQRCEKLWWPVAYASFILFGAGLLFGGIFTGVFMALLVTGLLAIVLYHWKVEQYLERHGETLSKLGRLGGMVADIAAAFKIARCANRIPWFLCAEMFLAISFILILVFVVISSL